MENDLLTLDYVAELIGKSVKTVRRLVYSGDLEAIYPATTGMKGRPKMMITASSYGKYLLRKAGKQNG